MTAKDFAKYEEFAKISKSVAEIASNFNLCMDEDDIEKHIETVPEELINEELLELKQKSIAEEKGENKTAGEGKEEKPIRKFTVKCLADVFPDLNKLLKKSETKDPNTESMSLTLYALN
jgi:DNA mismatch repair ATPase MutS